MPALPPFQVKAEGGKKYLVVDCRAWEYGTSVADHPATMEMAIELVGRTEADILVLSELYDRVYDEDQTSMLREVADLIQKFKVKGVWGPSYLGGRYPECNQYLKARHEFVVNVCSDLLRTDPVRAYLKVLEAIRVELQNAKKAENKKCFQDYLTTLNFVKINMESLTLIQKVRQYITKLKKMPPGRQIYHVFFEAQIKPAFIGSRILLKVPEEIELVDQYNVLGAQVNIYKHPERVDYLYYVNPPEYSLTPEEFFLVSKTKEIVSTYHPEGLEFTDLATSADYFKKIYETTIADLARQHKIRVSSSDIKRLSDIVARYTVGYGLMGLLLSDERLTDIYMDAPLGLKPVHVVHSDYGPAETNILFSEEEAQSIISRFRSLSGRPFDEAHSVLDMDLAEYHTRVAVIGPPLSPDGVAFALRIHKSTPWTLPQFINVKMVSPELAGLLSFFIDAQASTLVVGSRGAGKTSLMQALMLEILPSLRILTIEDTLEIPAKEYWRVGYKLQRLKTRSAISVGAITSEVSPEDALREALRLGDSCIIVGEVRSKEALVLYEAMRVGAVSNVVMGTIHGEDAYSIWDRVVHDLGVPNTSFKATDLVVVAAPIRFKGSLKKNRRVIGVTEILKEWTEDPKQEGGLLDIVTYDATVDEWKIDKEAFMKKSHKVKYLEKTRGLSPEEMWVDIEWRAKTKKYIADLAKQIDPEIAEARYYAKANSKWAIVLENQREATGILDYENAYKTWKEWVDKNLVKEVEMRKRVREQLKKQKGL